MALTDFQTLLKQSILARGIRDPEKRQAVYQQARTAFIRQMTAERPALGSADIARRVVEFDRAMRQIEDDLVAENVAEEAGVDPRDEIYAPDDSDDEADAERMYSREVAVRGRTSDRALVEHDDDLPLPAAFSDHWKDEEAVYREEEPVAVKRTRLPPPQRRLGWTLNEKDKVRVLVGAIATLGLVLLGLLVYLLLPGRDGGVTLPINPAGQVSDAGAADRIAGATLDVKQSFVLFDGRDPTVFQASPDNPVRFDSDRDGGFARVGTSTGASGVRVFIGPGLASRLAGENIRVVIGARSSVERGALNMRFAYQSGVALSHWQTANLARGYANSGMTWIVPQMRTSPSGADYLIIEPGIPGDGTYADIRSIRIDVLASAPTN
jgi:hypothetical protein